MSIIENFGDKRGIADFSKNPQNINRKGQPRKGVSLVNQLLKEEGYDPVSKQDIETNYMSMMNLGRTKLNEMKDDESQPMLVRILAENLLSKKGFDIVEKMLDRGIGKATDNRKIELEGTINLLKEEDLID